MLLSTLDTRSLNAVLASPLQRFTDATITDAPTLRRELARVREQGYAVAADEEEEGLTGVSAGIFDAGDLVGVVTLGGPTQRLLPLDGRNTVPELLGAARQIERTLRPSG